jgi:hypothetical protein
MLALVVNVVVMLAVSRLAPVTTHTPQVAPTG